MTSTIELDYGLNIDNILNIFYRKHILMESQDIYHNKQQHILKKKNQVH